MESDINSEGHRSPDDILQKGCAHTLTRFVTVSEALHLVYITGGVNNSGTCTLEHTLLMLGIRGEERTKTTRNQSPRCISTQGG